MPDPNSPSPTPSDDFDQVLKDLARPSSVGGVLLEKASETTHPLGSAVAQAARDAGYPGVAPQPGDVLGGRYRITGVLGRGGMGVVLEAEQILTRKVVAIKWMNSARAQERSAEQVARFLREARAVANIQHPNVVDLYDVGDSDGVPFLVLERLRGESLRNRLERGPLDWKEAAGFMLGVLSGLGAVHRAGIVHRDLKPDNIFLTDQDGHVIPKVLDFGVAAVRESVEDELDTLTRTGALLGTPAYMALEQLTGAGVDERADLYALGVVLYEMTTGRLPFEARSAADLAVSQATLRPQPPSRLAPHLSNKQDAIVLRALARMPEERFRDSAAFAAALSETLKGNTDFRGWRSLLAAAALVASASAALTLASLENPKGPGHLTQRALPPKLPRSGAPTQPTGPQLPRAVVPEAAEVATTPAPSEPPIVKPTPAPSSRSDAPGAARAIMRRRRHNAGEDRAVEVGAPASASDPGRTGGKEVGSAGAARDVIDISLDDF